MGLKLKTKKSMAALCAFGATDLMMSGAVNQDTVVGKDSGHPSLTVYQESALPRQLQPSSSMVSPTLS